ncbi:MAG TPA: hypothetical protein VFR02_08955, partial [bacterium]|nr:hypothetical protein [bacterium]
QGASATGVIWMATLGAILSFLLFNWRPAKVYLGDTGSSALGGLAAILLVGLGSPGPSLFYFLQPDQPVPEAVRFHFVAATLLAGYPALEVTLSAFRRGAKFLYFGRSMEWSEQEHIHHRLLKLGIKPGAICLTACLCQVLFSSAGVLIMVKQNALATWLMVPFLMGFAYAAPRLGIVRFLGMDQSVDKPYYRIAHNFIAFQRSKLALARSREQILALVSQTCREFGVRCFRFKIQPDAGGKGGMDYLFRVPETRMDARDLHLMDNPADGEKGWYFDYYEIPGRRDEAFWLFDHHAGDDELDVEYRVLMSGFMREALQFAVILGEGLETLDLPSVMTLPHDEMSGHRLRQRDRSKFN